VRERIGRGGLEVTRAWPPFAALLLVAVEGALALVGVRWAPLSALVLVAVPGLALHPLLPGELGALGRWLAVPLVGCAAASVVLIAASALGLPLTGVSIRLLLAAVAAAGVVAARRLPAASDRHARTGGLSAPTVALALAAILCVGVALQGRVIGGNPVPGTDWGHYLLYPHEIARQHSLLIDNPYWMLGGERFRDDPGVGSLYGSFLVMSEEDTAVLVHGIWVFAVLSIVSVFLLT
jgi:hypothetical protein